LRPAAKIGRGFLSRVLNSSALKVGASIKFTDKVAAKSTNLDVSVARRKSPGKADKKKLFKLKISGLIQQIDHLLAGDD